MGNAEIDYFFDYSKKCNFSSEFMLNDFLPYKISRKYCFVWEARFLVTKVFLDLRYDFLIVLIILAAWLYKKWFHWNVVTFGKSFLFYWLFAYFKLTLLFLLCVLWVLSVVSLEVPNLYWLLTHAFCFLFEECQTFRWSRAIYSPEEESGCVCAPYGSPKW